MPGGKSYKVRTKSRDLFLRVSKGHFATSHSHINYYIDVTTQKTRLNEASAVAQKLVAFYENAPVDTILCLDGTEVIGTCLALELSRTNIYNLNANKNISVITPEHTTGSQLICRDNMIPMIKNKVVLVLAASVTTGYTAQAAVEAVNYYGGSIAGVCAIFATLDVCVGYPVRSVFDPNDLQDYASYPSHECPLCKQGLKIDALVNSFGYSKL